MTDGAVHLHGNEYVAYMRKYRERTSGIPPTSDDIEAWRALRDRHRSLGRWRFIMFGVPNPTDD